jgi:hypothetical protein
MIDCTAHLGNVTAVDQALPPGHGCAAKAWPAIEDSSVRKTRL